MGIQLSDVQWKLGGERIRIGCERVAVPSSLILHHRVSNGHQPRRLSQPPESEVDRGETSFLPSLSAWLEATGVSVC